MRKRSWAQIEKEFKIMDNKLEKKFQKQKRLETNILHRKCMKRIITDKLNNNNNLPHEIYHILDLQD